MGDTHPRRKRHKPAATEDQYSFPDDVLVEILTRLPPNSRRRARLVCRVWRDAVDERTPTNLKSRAKLLAFTFGSAHVIDDPRKGGPSREVWTNDGRAAVGTCNGLVCLCDDLLRGGAVSLVNPVTREALALPRPPWRDRPPRPVGIIRNRAMKDPAVKWHRTYGFGRDHATGKYKIVHLPCYRGEFDAVQVLTVGESSWRSVPAPGAGGVVSVEGAVCWVTKGRESIMSFDLGKERLAATQRLPEEEELGYGFHLVAVRDWLGIAVNIYRTTDTNGNVHCLTKVWVLEGSRWSASFEMLVHGLEQQLTAPHFALGDFVLTNGGARSTNEFPRSTLHMHRVGDKQMLLCVVDEAKEGAAVADLRGDIKRTFAYVETTEPLGIYGNVVIQNPIPEVEEQPLEFIQMPLQIQEVPLQPIEFIPVIELPLEIQEFY